MEEIEKTAVPAGGKVNKPSSGTYGEKAARDELASALPGPGQGPPGGQGAAPPMAPQQAQPGAVPARPGPPGPQGPPGMPDVLASPTTHPNRPLATPLATPPSMPQRAGQQDRQRVAILDALTSHPDVSDEMKEWAEIVLERIHNG